jgi:tetratricopeptide (TPR) repeat protein
MPKPGVFALLVLLGCARTPSTASKAASSAQPRVIDPITDRSRPSGNVPLSDSAKAVEAAYRLAPDRRFVLAAADIQQILTHRKPSSVTLDFDDGRWVIRCDGAVAGELTDLPKFSDGMAMLIAWAKNLGRESRVALPPGVMISAQRDVESFDSPALFRALGNLARVSGGKPLDAAAMRLAARAMTLLNLQMVDRFELAESVRARALAILAISRSLDPSPGDEDLAMMTALCGYETEARALAETLPEGSVARELIRATPRDPGQGATRAMLYVAARNSVLADHVGDPQKALQPFLPVLRTQAVPLALLDEDDSQPIGLGVAALMVDDVSGHAESTKPALDPFAPPDSVADHPGRLLTRFERGLPARIRASQSALFDGAEVRAFHEALFYSAIGQVYRFLAVHLFDREGVRSFLSDFDSSVSPTDSEMLRWMEIASAARFDPNAAGASMAELLKLRAVGGVVRAEVLSDIAAALGGNTPAVRGGIKQMFARLDSRPAGMIRAGLLAISVQHPLCRDLYFRKGVERAPSLVTPGTMAWVDHLTGNREDLRVLADRPDLRSSDRAFALDYLDQLGDDQAWIRARFQRLLDVSYDDVYTTYAGFLNRHHDWAAKEKAARHWLDTHPSDQGIQRAYYASSCAKALEQMGRYDEAWRLVEPQIEVFSGNILASAVSLLQRRGELGRANDLGRQMIERYPNVAARTDFAIVLWREGRWREAAELFDPRKASLRRDEWIQLFPAAFADAFADGPDERALSAFDALVQVHVDPAELAEITAELMKRGKPAMAFALAQSVCDQPNHRVSAHDPQKGLDHINAYKALKAWKGYPAASDWLRARVPDEAVLEMELLLYENDGLEAMWDLASPRANAVKNIELQVHLVSSLVRQRVPPSDARWIQLGEITRNTPKDRESLLSVNEYLFGLIDEKEFAAWPTNAVGRCAVQYYISLKAAARGDYPTALPWMVAAADGPAGSVPQLLALTMLGKWSSGGLSWAETTRRSVL